MFAYPPSAAVNRPIPKNRIYQYTKARSRLQTRFVEEVEKITWLFKLAPETLNLAAQKPVLEVQVFGIQLKGTELSESVLQAIDRAIPHPIAYEISSTRGLRFAMAYKRPSEAEKGQWVVEEYWYSEWLTQDALRRQPLPLALNLNALYERILRSHIGAEGAADVPIGELVTVQRGIREYQRAIAALESRLSKERQFNRKVEINQELRTAREALAQLQSQFQHSRTWTN